MKILFVINKFYKMSVHEFIESCLKYQPVSKFNIPIFFLSEKYGGTAINDDILEDIKIRICSINHRKEVYGLKTNEALVLINENNKWNIYRI